ncbi:hypothetical protein [Streptomyces sp. CA2R106]|uniref:hypothetical protein n=1 Tax=Streptomyces sp. CA2R106 TaxID=3120153 RepID=UPI0030081092
MSVKVDWQQSPGPGPRRPSAGRGGPRKKRFGKDARLFAAVGVGLVAAVVAALVTHGNGKGGKGHAGPSPSASPSASASASVDTGGMAQGLATAAGSDCIRRVSGLPWGCPHTTAGAVDAATQVMAASFQAERMTVADRTAWMTAVFGKVPAGTEDAAKLYQAQNNLNSAGQLINTTTGEPVTDQRFTSLCHPELGAYRIQSATADAAEVDVWQVCISGTIGPGTARNLSANWVVAEVSLTWKGGDWQVTGTTSGGFNTAPAPKDAGQAVTTFPERAQILASYGSGWTLYGDASQSNPAETRGAQ